MKKHILAVLVVNKTGVLNKITGLYSRRGFNIESLSVGTTEKEGISRITITLYGDEHTVSQITSQLEKLVDVLSVRRLETENTVGREVCFIKLRSGNENRSHLLELAGIFRASVIDAGNEAITVLLTGTPEKTEAFLSLVSDFGIIEVVRSGLMAIERGARALEDQHGYNEE